MEWLCGVERQCNWVSVTFSASVSNRQWVRQYNSTIVLGEDDGIGSILSGTKCATHISVTQLTFRRPTGWHSGAARATTSVQRYPVVCQGNLDTRVSYRIA